MKNIKDIDNKKDNNNINLKKTINIDCFKTIKRYIYEKFDFDVKSNIIVSNELVNKNLLFTNICFTQLSYDTTKIIQDCLCKIIKENIPVYFYTIYERYLVTVPESLYHKYDMKKHFSFINKMDFEYVI